MPTSPCREQQALCEAWSGTWHREVAGRGPCSLAVSPRRVAWSFLESRCTHVLSEAGAEPPGWFVVRHRWPLLRVRSVQ